MVLRGSTRGDSAPTLPRRDIERFSREPELEVDASGMERVAVAPTKVQSVEWARQFSHSLLGEPCPRTPPVHGRQAAPESNAGLFVRFVG